MEDVSKIERLLAENQELLRMYRIDYDYALSAGQRWLLERSHKTILELLKRQVDLASRLALCNMQDVTIKGALFLLDVPHSEVDGLFYIHP